MRCIQPIHTRRASTVDSCPSLNGCVGRTAGAGWAVQRASLGHAPAPCTCGMASASKQPAASGECACCRPLATPYPGGFLEGGSTLSVLPPTHPLTDDANPGQQPSCCDTTAFTTPWRRLTVQHSYAIVAFARPPARCRPHGRGGPQAGDLRPCQSPPPPLTQFAACSSWHVGLSMELCTSGPNGGSCWHLLACPARRLTGRPSWGHCAFALACRPGRPGPRTPVATGAVMHTWAIAASEAVPSSLTRPFNQPTSAAGDILTSGRGRPVRSRRISAMLSACATDDCVMVCIAASTGPVRKLLTRNICGGAGGQRRAKPSGAAGTISRGGRRGQPQKEGGRAQCALPPNCPIFSQGHQPLPPHRAGQA